MNQSRSITLTRHENKTPGQTITHTNHASEQSRGRITPTNRAFQQVKQSRCREHQSRENQSRRPLSLKREGGLSTDDDSPRKGQTR